MRRYMYKKIRKRKRNGLEIRSSRPKELVLLFIHPSVRPSASHLSNNNNINNKKSQPRFQLEWQLYNHIEKVDRAKNGEKKETFEKNRDKERRRSKYIELVLIISVGRTKKRKETCFKKKSEKAR